LLLVIYDTGPQDVSTYKILDDRLELEIKTLQNAPRDRDKLEQLLNVKQRQKEEAVTI
jgi:hypothetical protein